MGTGRSKVGTAWKSQLKAAAKQGKMPRTIIGDTKAQSAILKEIDRLYPMPAHEDAHVNDNGDMVTVNWRGRVKGMYYPSRENASESEKRGVLKMLLWNF